MKNKEIDVVLSGSGVKMMAFVGALKAIEEYGCKVKRIAGTSGGAIIGSIYAAGLDSDQIKDLIMDWNYKKMVFKSINPFAWFRWGLISSRGLYLFLKKIYGNKTFNELKKCELVCTGSNISIGRIDYFQANKEYGNMKIALAARISSTVPLAMGYVKYKGSAYVDGGLFNNYPIDIFDDHLRPTIGVRTSGTSNQPKKVSIWNPLNYIKLMLESSAENAEREHIEDADWAHTIQLRVNHVASAMEYDLTKEKKLKLYKIGYETTKKKLPAILGG